MSGYSRRAGKIADAAVALVQEHERRRHGGERCPEETINFLAYLAHRLGVHAVSETPEDAIRAFVERVRDYTAVYEEYAEEYGG